MCLGLPGQVVEILGGADQHARVAVNGTTQDVSVAMLGDDGVQVGDWVVVHLGFAMDRISEEGARDLLESLGELEDLYERELSGDR